MPQPRTLASSVQRLAADRCLTSAAQALPALRPFRLQVAQVQRQAKSLRAHTSRVRQQPKQTHATYPEPETEKERSPLDYPQVQPICMDFCEVVHADVAMWPISLSDATVMWWRASATPIQHCLSMTPNSNRRTN